MQVDGKGKQALLDKLFDALEKSVVVVEGKNDAEALAEAGVQCACVLMAGLKPEKVVEKIIGQGNEKIVAQQREQIVLLTDFDDEGERKEKELKRALAEAGLKADDGLRRKFRRLFGINTVEQLPFALRRLEKETLVFG